MKNNNQSIVRKIAVRNLAANRGVNFFILLAVFLTTFTLGSIISISVSYMESLETFRIRLEGTTAHIGLMNINEKQIEIIKNLDYVSSYSTGFTAADIVNDDYTSGHGAMLVWLDPSNWEIFRKPAFSNIKGAYPQSFDEIMVPVWILDNMGIKEPKTGMEIKITYQTDAGGEVSQVFKLSGYFTSYVRLRAGGNEGMFVSQEFAKSTGRTVKDHGNVQIRYVNDNKVQEYNKRLALDLLIDEDRDIYTVAKYNPLSENNADPLYIVFTMLAVILVLAGYLFIYNVLSVSVSRDIRFYGLLKTIGMTSKQIRMSVYMQILYICGLGVPAGLLLSAVISFVFIPGVLTALSGDIIQTGSVVSFNPLIYLSASLFAVLTALTGALIPAKKASGISPIEAARFSEQQYSNRKKIRSSAFNPIKTAWRNVFRVRLRAVMVFISLFLGMTIFMAVTVILESANIDKMVESSMKNTEGDINLLNRKADYAIIREIESSDSNIFTQEFITQLELLPGLTNIVTRNRYPVRVDLGALDDKGNIYYMPAEAFALERNEAVKLREEYKLSFNTDAFERGEYVLAKNLDRFIELTNREILSINVLFDDNAQPREFNIGGHLNPDTYFSPIESGLRNIKEIYFASDYLHKQSAEPVIYDIALYIEEPSQRRALAMVKELTRGQLNLKRISSIEVREEFENIRIILFALGGGISIILLVIGILNFINIITTSILSRRREIALLESIGQSKKQTIAILTLEGAIYAALTFLFSGIFGGAFTYAIYSALAKQFDYVIFNLPLIPLSVMACAALLICLGLPGLAFRSVSGLTLVERLREAE